MKRSFIDKYGVSLLVIAVGVWFVAKQLGFAFSLGKLIMIVVGISIVMYGVKMIKQSRSTDDYKEQSWDYYNPNMAPPPPPPDDTPFSSVNVDPNKGYSGMKSEHVPPNDNTAYTKYSSDRGTIERSVFIGDIHYGKQHWELKPMNLSAFIGDMKLDLSKAHIPYGETRIRVSAFIGDVKVFVPNDVTLGVSIQMNSFIGDTKLIDQKESGLMGSYHLSTPNYEDCDRKIYLEVSTFIGDVKVKKVG